jgi:hypothetical protein
MAGTALPESMLEPATLEDCMPQPPRVGLIGMGDPVADGRIDVTETDRDMAPLVTECF